LSCATRAPEAPMSRPLSLALVLLVPVAARPAPPPEFVKIEDKGGKLAAPITVTKFETVTREVNTNPRGVAVTRRVQEQVPVTVTEYRVLNAEAGEFYTPAGDKIDPKKLGDVL